MSFSRGMMRIAMVLALAIGGMAVLPATAASAQGTGVTSHCSGTLIRHEPIGSYGHLDIYYDSSSGFNCARTVSSSSTWGERKYMEITLAVCRNSGCTNWGGTDAYFDQDYGQFKYYAGPVTVNGYGKCIRWWAQIKTKSLNGYGHCG